MCNDCSSTAFRPRRSLSVFVPDEDLHGRNAILQLLHMFAARMLNNATDYLSEVVAMSLYGIIQNGAIWLHKYTWMPRREEQQKWFTTQLVGSITVKSRPISARALHT